MNIWNTVKSWYSQPYQSNMSVTMWFVFLGLLIALSAAWRVILGHIARDA